MHTNFALQMERQTERQMDRQLKYILPSVGVGIIMNLDLCIVTAKASGTMLDQEVKDQLDDAAINTSEALLQVCSQPTIEEGRTRI